MLKITLKNVNYKLTDKALIKETALALKNKYKFYMLYKKYSSRKEYVLWISYQKEGENLSLLRSNLKNMEKEKNFDSYLLQEIPPLSFLVLMDRITKENTDPDALKLEYRRFKMYDRETKKWSLI